MLNPFERIIRAIPCFCLLCDGPAKTQDICDSCEKDLPWITNCCVVCSLPLPENGVTTCADCRNHSTPFSCILTPLEYRFPVNKMINRFKHQRHLADGALLAQLMAKRLLPQLKSISNENNLIVPVPLHRKRLRERGFNQAELLARHIAAMIGDPLSTRVCQRVDAESPLQEKSGAGRIAAVKGAFRASEDLHGQRIFLVDDVVTSCSTVTELSRVLLSAGASDVVILAAARTPSNAI